MTYEGLRLPSHTVLLESVPSLSLQQWLPIGMPADGSQGS
jgi:hypothetical protein